VRAWCWDDNTELRQLIEHDIEALSEYEELMPLEPHGGDRRSEEAKDRINVNIVNVDPDKIERPQGNANLRALRHLREKRPDLLERVKNGELSPHKAMREAGFRPPTMTVNLDSVATVFAKTHGRAYIRSPSEKVFECGELADKGKEKKSVKSRTMEKKRWRVEKRIPRI
jgi:hypothetical protein